MTADFILWHTLLFLRQSNLPLLLPPMHCCFHCYVQKVTWCKKTCYLWDCKETLQNTSKLAILHRAVICDSHKKAPWTNEGKRVPAGWIANRRVSRRKSAVQSLSPTRWGCRRRCPAPRACPRTRALSACWAPPTSPSRSGTGSSGAQYLWHERDKNGHWSICQSCAFSPQLLPCCQPRTTSSWPPQPWIHPSQGRWSLCFSPFCKKSWQWSALCNAEKLKVVTVNFCT